MSGAIRVFVNERAVDVDAGSTVAAAVQAFDASLAERLERDEAYITDGRGIRMPADVLLSPGTILRVVVPARRAAGSDDADA